MNQKNVSVLLCVFNGMPYLVESVESILRQYDQLDEFVIVDDASTDGTSDFLRSISKETKIKVLRNSENIGLTRSLNIGLDHCEGRYVARQDADDISNPSRLRSQRAYMDLNPGVFLLGAGATYISTTGKKIMKKVQVMDPNSCKDYLLINNPIVHSSAFFRRLLDDGSPVRYDADFTTAQDFELWSRLSNLGLRLENLDEILVEMRIHDASVSKTASRSQAVNHDLVIMKNWLSRVTDCWPLECDARDEAAVAAGRLLSDRGGPIPAIDNHRLVFEMSKRILEWMSVNYDKTGNRAWVSAIREFQTTPRLGRLSERVVFAFARSLYRIDKLI